jgi:hypothetical protein
MVNDDTPITGGDMNPDDESDNDNVFNSAGENILTPRVDRATAIYKKICNLVQLNNQTFKQTSKSNQN